MPTHIRYSLQSKTKFFIVLASVLATVAIASPADTTPAAPADESAVIKSPTNSPEVHQGNEDVPAPVGCYWFGAAPFCTGGYPEIFYEINRGQCSDSGCYLVREKVLCCQM